MSGRKQPFVVCDHDGLSFRIWGGKRLALWFGRGARRNFGIIEVFMPRPDWPGGCGGVQDG